MKRLTFALRMLVCTFFVLLFTDINSKGPTINRNMPIYRNFLTWIIVDSCYKSAYIYEFDNSLHPVLSEIIYRGHFNIVALKENFYSLQSELPGKSCLDSINIYHWKSDSNIVKIRFLLGMAKKEYTIVAKSIKTDTVYKINYPQKCKLILPVEEEVYIFSIIPSVTDYYSLSVICSGFGHTIKYLNLPQIEKDYFSYPGYIEISLPLFDDDIFNIWCANGEIIRINKQILNDKIIWHGKEFKLYEQKRMFNF